MAKSRQRYHHGDLRKALIDEAVRVIQARGSVDFSIRDLAAGVHVTHAAAYRHFDNKSAILAAVAERGFELLRVALDEVDPVGELAAPEKLRRQGVAYVIFAVRNAGYFRAMFHADLRDKSKLPGLARISQAAYERLSNSVEECRQAGMFTQTAADLVTAKAWAMVHGLAFLAIDGQWPGGPAVAPNDEEALAKLARQVDAVLAAES